mmetsp:Transcript_23476/g.20569  ORF Transcript_23476/g.20569 Transcript_23476/m.20569 type:complete len:297 (-) Transcript_23476:183-1073(-)|eukprot:CAMPEP_0201577080 /NCGR_PEP_ID=MMETSP0190_2-20130828/23280_1 /ASSEMBLY_ACC=CAM_ASM_000263 /TAXON_ID=37353 /ORGANISM="Rosalina sp." /LENGTH=296 /DNA_ID=CAMNT_0048008705 /DNA_START=42 /DNA_END=932 /DNA_ORIENTATION=-
MSSSRTDSPDKKNHVPKTYKTILSGGFAGMISKTCTAPLERVQMLNQTGATHDTIAGTIKRILRDDGVRGLWRGNLANCVRVFPHKSILFSVNESLQKSIVSNSSYTQFATGALSGLIATGATYPIDVIRAYLAGTFDKRTNSMYGVAKNIIKDSGLRGLYTGFGVTCVGAVPYEAARIGVYGVLRDKIPTVSTKYGQEPHPFGKLCAGAIAGAAAGFTTYPTDTIRRMLQVQSAEGMPMYDGVIQCIKINFQQGGMRRFYHGLSAKLARVIPDAAILFLAYESLKDFFDDIYFRK